MQHIDNIGVHYAKTLREWRRRFNLDGGMEVRKLGFDDTFVRVWNYYLTYCEAGFATQTGERAKQPSLLEDEHTRDEVRENMAIYIMATSTTKLNPPKFVWLARFASAQKIV